MRRMLLLVSRLHNCNRRYYYYKLIITQAGLLFTDVFLCDCYGFPDEVFLKRKDAQANQKRLVSPDRISASSQGIDDGLRLINAKLLTAHLSWIATAVTFVSYSEGH